MIKKLHVPPSFIERLNRAPLLINNRRVVQRVDDLPSLVRMIADYHRITTWQAQAAVLKYYDQTHDGPQIFNNHTSLDEPTDCRQAVHRTFKSWLSEFALDANHKSPSNLANQMAMSGFGAPWPPEEIDDYENLWLNTHRRLYDRALIKILRNARKWSAVRKFLVTNKDRHGQTIYDEEWHPAVLASLALYEKRARKRKAKEV